MKRIEPGPGQESVWDYPRPPALERTQQHVVVKLDGLVIADSFSPFRVLETSHPPVYYIDPNDFADGVLAPTEGTSFCEYKGEARYFDIVAGAQHRPRAAWYYPTPTAKFAAMANFVAVYASRVDECWVDDEMVQAQEGDFYGGWITDAIVGPFKGGAGTWGW